MHHSTRDIQTLVAYNSALLDYSAQCCDYLFGFYQHDNPLQLHHIGVWQGIDTMAWQSVTNSNGFQDLDVTKEYAAYGLAMLFITQNTAYKFPIRRRKGTGVDFQFYKSLPTNPWLQPITDSDAIAVEVKGTGRPAYVRARIRRAYNQAKERPVYLVVAEFKTPSLTTEYHES